MLFLRHLQSSGLTSASPCLPFSPLHAPHPDVGAGGPSHARPLPAERAAGAHRWAECQLEGHRERKTFGPVGPSVLHPEWLDRDRGR